MLSTPEPGQAHSGNSIIYFTVDDINAAYRELTARDVPFDGQPHMIAEHGPLCMDCVLSRTTEQNLLGIMSEVQHT